MTLPDEFVGLTSLETLILDYSSIKVLPRSIEQLKNLKDLRLRMTEITTLPNELGQLNNLEHLMLEGSPLRTLPASIADLKKLRRLHLDHEFLKNRSEENRQTNLQMISNLIKELPRLGCLNIRAPSWQPFDGPETPETLSFPEKLMHNRGTTRFRSSFPRGGGVSIPLGTWPFILKRAKYLNRPYERPSEDHYDFCSYECWCCKGETIQKKNTQAGAIFELLKTYAPIIFLKEPQESKSSKTKADREESLSVSSSHSDPPRRKKGNIETGEEQQCEQKNSAKI